MPRARIEAIDGLRALALLPVVVVNFVGYPGMPSGALLPAPAADEGVLAWATGVAVLALLQGKGLALLMLLFGLGLTLGGAAPQRLNRLLGLGLLHGLLLYMGDIVSQYALLGRWLRRWQAWRPARLWRRVRLWLGVGLLLQLTAALVAAWLAQQAEAHDDLPLADWTGLPDWWRDNTIGYLSYLVGVLLLLWPWMLGLTGLGLLVGRLRVLTHRRWLPLRQRLARWAAPMLLLQLLWSAAMAPVLLGGGHAVAECVQGVLGTLAVLVWVPWLLQALPRWPAWLVAAGRQTLSLYLLCSLATVLTWCAWAGGWRPGLVPACAAAVLLWAGLMALGAWATRRGLRLPAEAWLAARRPARAPMAPRGLP
ncbi:hypothetical protein [Aquabacterium sp. OR-4]|uniref:hypothetical protein n=1 Tax=Aquabacterium sp. OR-4 TaxID=2978127 RepID=UPI0021B1C0AA|nr:hypothetical protein [Aquabacterium sp. OR-4]MDT7837516.1 hypothetical protein [Aquabacterium sp. OR-4]